MDLMPQPDTDLFAHEHDALSSARAVYENAAGESACRAALGELMAHYERLLREMRRLIRRSDREEFEMNRLNQRLNELAGELEFRANHDPLTGVLNRAAVIDIANGILQREALALVVLDIDHFKQVNDSFGHPAGDAVICGVVECLRRLLPERAEVGRVGGEEFSVLLPGFGFTQARGVAEAMRGAIAGYDFRLPGGRRVTASFGISRTARGAGFDQAYGQADEALYGAKRGGRNRVVCADSVSSL
ncbi:MAG: GGDEF domain-containing protein [Candidatus Dactylopiibacterium sp.]|nr:GGDEF domain-containing protein [Candidatus Dactylopiibacterium sp.]